MKRIISGIVLVVMLLSVLASCNLGGTTAGATLDDAMSFFGELYKDKNETTPSNWDVVAKVVVKETEFKVTWESDSDKVTITKKNDNFYTVNIPAKNDAEFSYTLTATVTDAAGASQQKSYTFKVPVIDNSGITSTPVAGTAYKLFLTQVNLGQKLYATTKTQSNNKYIETSADPKAGADFFVEVVEGGYKFYTEIEGVKNYVYATTVAGSNGKPSKYLGYSAEEGSVFYYKENVKCWFVKIDDIEYYMGTYGTYSTFCISDGSYITAENTGVAQFPSTFITKAVAETLEADEKVDKEIPQMDGATEPVAGTAYNFGFVHGNKDNAVYYVTGALSGYYMATVTEAADAAKVYVEATDGGYYLYAMVDGAKLYINMVVSGSYVNGKYEEAASTVYTYDATLKTLKASVGGADYIYGTSNAGTYTTVGPVKASDEPFYLQFVPAA